MLSPETANFSKKLAITKPDLQFLFPYCNIDRKQNEPFSNLYFEKYSKTSDITK